MNQTIKDLKERRSCRSFKPTMVDKKLINQVIEAGLYAPSAMGKQATRIIAITNKEVRQKLAEDNATICGWPKDFDPFYGAPVILIVLGEKDFPPSIYDGSLVMGNMMNAAHSLGLGSIWIHRAKEEFETEFYKNLLKEHGLEGEYIGVGHCALGYIDGKLNEPAPRKTDHVIWIE